jgi:hypothetical protein
MTARRPASKLLRTWMIASSAYVLGAIGFSVTPIRDAIAAAGPAPQSVQATESRHGREATEPPTVRIARTVGKQALITFAPPALALWFGWDVWFAIQGFSRRGGATPEAERHEADRTPASP